MRKTVTGLLCLLLILLTACSREDPTPAPAVSVSETVFVTEASVPVIVPPEPEAAVTPEAPVLPLTSEEPVLPLTPEEKTMLLKIGMAERGKEGCTECIALVMRTLLNRVESGRFGSSIRSVLFSPEQFTPVMDGSYDSAQPNECCYDALEMVVHGWDESHGALYYEWCVGESWHSKNLHLLFQHCDTRFYD